MKMARMLVLKSNGTCLALLVGSLAAPAAAAAQTKITVGVVAHAATQLADYWTVESGCAKERGIELEFVTVGAGGAQQLAAGSLNVSQSGFPDYFRAIAQGAPIKIFINNNSVPPYSVHAKSTIKSVKELKGKTISIGGVKDVTLIYMRPFLAAGGLTTADVDFVYGKATGDRFTALNAGAIDATILNPPASFRADGLGFSNLGEIADQLPDYPFTVWAVNATWAAKNKQAVASFAFCHLRGVAWIYDRMNRDAAIAMIIKRTKADRNDAEKTYDYLTSRLKAFSRTGMLTEALFDRMKAGLLEMGDLIEPVPPLSHFFDASYLAAAN
jgi:ABC-type nitrate/sulfonate/bicarbonate transport system substrate-binding protein